MCVECADFASIFFSLQSEKFPYFSLSFALNVYERRTLGAPVWPIYFFRFKAKKIPYFGLSFALSEYEQRTLGAPVSLIYFCGFKPKKIPYSFA
jgi:hypothetical protein